jgi:hypothetical protein
MPDMGEARYSLSSSSPSSSSTGRDYVYMFSSCSGKSRVPLINTGKVVLVFVYTSLITVSMAFTTQHKWYNLSRSAGGLKEVLLKMDTTLRSLDHSGTEGYGSKILVEQFSRS